MVRHRPVTRLRVEGPTDAGQGAVPPAPDPGRSAGRRSRAREPAIAPSPPAHPLREAQEQKHGGAYYMYVAS